ncbi:MAG: thioredoxin [Gammaproteobacteria bacterium HGW-Gammaproteobacteria-14]|nr:MAG: thioredoxin [Gammaproteobacteria bacterium HGW-Gammaproteobacteria-14]
MSGDSDVMDVTRDNLQQVIQRSLDLPVILDFWADWCQPCQQMAPVLEKMVRELSGKVLLAKVNADDQPEVAAQFGVRSLPTLKLVFQGRLVDEISGAQTEASLRQWLEPVLLESDPQAQLEAFMDQLRLAIEHGHAAEAEAALRSALEQEPGQHALRAMLVEFLLSEGRRGEAESMLAEVTEDVPELRPFRARFALLSDFAEQNPVPLAEQAAQIASSPTPEMLYRYGLQAAAAGQFQAGLDALLWMLRTYPEHGDGLAKVGLLRVFECLPKGDPLASEYRRKMFNYLH